MKAYTLLRGFKETKIMEVDMLEAVSIMRKNENVEVLIGADVYIVMKVFGEYAPFKIIKNIEAFFNKGE